eukprot:11945876-Prorocentrum_lima.AAC.1
MLEAALPRAAYVKKLKRKLAAESSKLEGLQDQLTRTSEAIGQAEDEIERLQRNLECASDAADNKVPVHPCANLGEPVLQDKAGLLHTKVP